MLLSEYNRRLLGGEKLYLGPGKALGVTVPIGLQLDIKNISRGVRREVACPYCHGKHLHSMVDLGEIVDAPCGERQYLIATESVVTHAGLEIDKGASK